MEDPLSRRQQGRPPQQGVPESGEERVEYRQPIAYAVNGTLRRAALSVESQARGAETRFGPVPDLYSSRHTQAGARVPILLLHLLRGFSRE